ncbi:MAG: helix-turn-helix transcriptional regulator [Gemmatimonas sp.]|jgi:DeoR family suf operon transcriptional repressor|uniref:helix-turn-helix transcriptional regulator n=1 Tax=Gemmatimonas sp. TaxID=1962908 RepID=UPI00391EEBF7|nr:helix-turn-helix domain-containing protein [Gemmatimonadota bacterium]
MEDVVGALGGFRGVRAELLVALKKAQPLTAGELGEQFGLTANALRRHLKALEEDGLVRYQREVRGVGAPVYAYSLSQAGEALFPRSYVQVLATALDALRAQRGDQAVEAVLEAEWRRLAEEAGPVLEALPLEERVPLVAELLTAKGYMAEVEPTSLTLRIHNCAMREIAERFPEACAVEAKFVERLLGVPLVRNAHRRDGCGRCEYGVSGHLSAVQQEQA